MNYQLIILMNAVFLAGCAAGPRFASPKTPDIGSSYTAEKLPATTAHAATAPGAQSFEPDADLPAQWWELFRCAPLDALIRTALDNSPTLSAARAALKNAQAQRRAQTDALYYPAVDATLSAMRQKFNGTSFGIPALGTTVFDLYNASVNVSYTFDVFGGSRRQVETLKALEDYQDFQLKAAHLALTANIVTTAVREASLRAQITATEQIIADEETQLTVIRSRVSAGAAAQPDVLAQQTLLAQSRAQMPQLQKTLEQAHTQLAVLCGILPSQAAALPQFSLEQFTLPEKLPLSVPAQLVRHRPDVRAQESLLHQASAQIGVSAAKLLPNISLTANYGWQADSADTLFKDETNTWAYGLSLQQAVYHGGELTAKRRAAADAYEQAASQYRQTVLIAFQNVADALRALNSDTETLALRTEAQQTARKTVDLTQTRFELGAISYPSLLSAQQQYQEAYLNFVQAQAALYADTAALFQALGGGWWNND